ncbi:MAG TPA: formate dehydrogenase subunit delta [Woeseiaceae bacterium]
MNDDVQPAVAGAVIDLERLITMANQIGDFFAPYPPERAREGLRNHLRTYWDPRMRNALLEHIDAGGEGLDKRVIDAAQLLRGKAADKSGYYGPPQETT